MFTGIVEAPGTVAALKKEQNNLMITIQCDFASELKAEESVAHNGVCLTVVNVFDKNKYAVVVVEETLRKTNLSTLKKGQILNLERAMKLDDRVDGHLVQGHVDTTAVCKKIDDEQGSKLFTFSFSKSPESPVIDKGSVCVNGVSLTVVETIKNMFSVAIIPYTFEHTNFKFLKKGDAVNIEFDIIGKYVQKLVRENKRKT